MFIEKASGKDFDRPKYQLLKKMVREGDMAVFDSITRLGRNMNETMNEYDWFVKNGVQLRFIKEPMINTTNEQDDIMKERFKKTTLHCLLHLLKKGKRRNKNKIC